MFPFYHIPSWRSHDDKTLPLANTFAKKAIESKASKYRRNTIITTREFYSLSINQNRILHVFPQNYFIQDRQMMDFWSTWAGMAIGTLKVLEKQLQNVKTDAIFRNFLGTRTLSKIKVRKGQERKRGWIPSAAPNGKWKKTEKQPLLFNV